MPSGSSSPGPAVWRPSLFLSCSVVSRATERIRGRIEQTGREGVKRSGNRGSHPVRFGQPRSLSHEAAQKLRWQETLVITPGRGSVRTDRCSSVNVAGLQSRKSPAGPAAFHADAYCPIAPFTPVLHSASHKQGTYPWQSKCVGDHNWMDAVTTPSRYLHFDNIDVVRVRVHARCSSCGRRFTAEPNSGEMKEEVVMRVREEFNKHDCSMERLMNTA